MPFSMICSECKKMQNPYLDKKTEKVYCEECEKEISNINHFAKIQLKTLKQYKVKSQKSFSVKCNKCNKEDRPTVKDKELYCSSCQEPMDHISPYFKKILIENLGSLDKGL